MKHYQHITEALRAALMMATRGYTQGVSFEVAADRVDAISAKWIDTYGLRLPGWKRLQRKRAGLPNAWACSMPVAGNPGRRQMLLMATEIKPGLDPASPWLRENWKPLERLEIGDFVIQSDRRVRGDYAMTVKLTKRCLAGLETYYREQASIDLVSLPRIVERDARYYPMFGGVRRQLRRLFRGYAKLYERKFGREWPGPDPDRLPTMGAFKRGESAGE